MVGELMSAEQSEPLIVVDERYCKGCGICVHFCPRQALKPAEKVNAQGYYVPYLARPDACSACRQCELLCPDFAIFVAEGAACDDG